MNNPLKFIKNYFKNFEKFCLSKTLNLTIRYYFTELPPLIQHNIIYFILKKENIEIIKVQKKLNKKK